MARIRTIKPDFFQSEDVSSLPLRARLTWIGLWTHCDDHGRHKDIGRLIKGRVWAMDDVSLRDIESDLDVLAEYGRIVRYEVDGKRYLAVTNWHRHQNVPKPSSPKYPGPETAGLQVGAPEPGETGHCGICWENEQKASSARVSQPSGRTTGTLPEAYPLERKGREGEGKGIVGDAIADGDPPRPDIEGICSHLADRIEANGSKRPPVTAKWRDAARLMLDRDGRTTDQIHGAIDWSQDDEFWRSNILSLPKLREKYDQLRLAAQRKTGPSGRQQQSDEMFDRAMKRAKEREEAS